jgi:hypothetical protein
LKGDFVPEALGAAKETWLASCVIPAFLKVPCRNFELKRKTESTPPGAGDGQGEDTGTLAPDGRNPGISHLDSHLAASTEDEDSTRHNAQQCGESSRKRQRETKARDIGLQGQREEQQGWDAAWG